jgi:hypothetical protein
MNSSPPYVIRTLLIRYSREKELMYGSVKRKHMLYNWRTDTVVKTILCDAIVPPSTLSDKCRALNGKWLEKKLLSRELVRMRTQLEALA